MTAAIDIWRAPHLLVQEYGAEEARTIADKRADALLELGELDGQRVWQGVLRAIAELSRGTRAVGEALS